MTDFINRLKNYLMETYNCDTIILYGSYSKGDFTSESDVDIICFRDVEEELNDTSFFEGKQLDVWIKNSKEELIAQEFLHIRDGKIIHDTESYGEVLLKSVRELFELGPPKSTLESKQFLVDWMNKMYIRSTKKDVEGTYRYFWLAKDVLEIYFEIKDLWYEGPKKSLKWLEMNDKEFYELYISVLNGRVASEKMKFLIGKLSECI